MASISPLIDSFRKLDKVYVRSNPHEIMLLVFPFRLGLWFDVFKSKKDERVLKCLSIDRIEVPPSTNVVNPVNFY